MRKRTLFTLLALTMFSCASAGFALIFIAAGGGAWPASWPKDLDAFRKQSRTVRNSGGSEEDIHQIPFQSREEFEKVWPEILRLKSPGAPITLESQRSAANWTVMPKIVAGVRIFCPSDARRGFSEETRNRPIPWPDSFKLPSGLWPEYLYYQDRKWVAASGTERSAEVDIYYRARTDLTLIVDGRIVDLNRIPLPADTPIIDHRFEFGSITAAPGAVIK